MLPELLNGLSSAEVGPTKQPFVGTHYSREKIKGGTLHGDKRGMTGEGEDSDRVYLPPRGAPAGVHVYENNGQVFGKHPSILARPHAYQVSGAYALADIDSEPLWAQAKQEVMNNTQGKMDPAQAELIARNEAEWKLREAGYDGYRSASSPGNVVLFGDHPATPIDKIEPTGAGQDQASNSADQMGGLGQDHMDASRSMSDLGADADSGTASSPRAFHHPFRIPLNPPDEHESHPPNSDPANLQSS